MDLDVYQVDSFTTDVFKGNPAGVCITTNALSESLMLSKFKRATNSSTFKVWLNSITGVVFIVFGSKLALIKNG